MIENAETIYQRALAASDADGRLPMPSVADWDTFPFDGDLRVRRLAVAVKIDAADQRAAFGRSVGRTLTDGRRRRRE